MLQAARQGKIIGHALFGPFHQLARLGVVEAPVVETRRGAHARDGARPVFLFAFRQEALDHRGREAHALGLQIDLQAKGRQIAQQVLVLHFHPDLGQDAQRIAVNAADFVRG